MQHLRQLLEMENSELARLLRFSLHGLEASLKQAQTQFPQDPGVEICDQVLQEIHHLLQPLPTLLTNQTQNTLASSKNDSRLEDALKIIPPPSSSPNLISVGKLQLSRLKEAFESDTKLATYLGNSQLQSQTDSDLWNEIQRKLLRVPEDLAGSWRQRALALAQETGARVDPSNLLQLPFIRNKYIYPGLTGTIQAAGLCLSEEASLNVAYSRGNELGELHLLACLVSICRELINIEPDLHHALKSIFSFDVVSFNSKPEQKEQYINTLEDRFKRTQIAEENAEIPVSLRAWIDMDEAINSLVFVPPADRYSWWGNLQQESRRILKKLAERANETGYNVRIRQLSGIYADICTLSKDDLRLDNRGLPGEVLACLRVYARINQEEFCGRVLYRPSR